MRVRTLTVLLVFSTPVLLIAGCTGNAYSNPQSAPQITMQPANQTVTAGQAASFSVSATGASPLTYQWQKNGSAISGATAATYTTPATTSADNGAQFKVVVSNSKGSATSNAATLTVTAASSVQITTASLPNGQVQTAYSATLQATGGTTPYTWSVSTGSLPPGLTLTAASGAISGTPSTAGTSSFTIQVADSAGNKASGGFTITITGGTGGGTMPQFGHVFIVIGENAGYTETFSSTTMPYLTSLANKYGISTTYWSDTHPSIGNYEALTAGQIFTNDDAQTPSTLPLSSDNIALEVQQAGKTWKDYVENLPSVSGCTGITPTGNYIVRHDPLEYYTNINAANIVCFSQFATDLSNHAVPNLSWISPNGSDDGHDTNSTAFDNFLQTVITPLLASSYFQSGGDGLLIITFDEGSGSGSPNCTSTTTTVGLGCGGQVETVLISARSKPGYQSTAGDPANWNNTYDETNILRTMADALGLKTSGLGGAANRVPMADFFQ